MPRFVLLYHDCPASYPRPSHWDLMLEEGNALRTWALSTLPRRWQRTHGRTTEVVPTAPAIADGDEVIAERLRDHRLEYLEFEGEVSNNRGLVVRVAAGSYRIEHELPDCIRLLLASDLLIGHVELRRSSAIEAHWTLSYQEAVEPRG